MQSLIDYINKQLDALVKRFSSSATFSRMVILLHADGVITVVMRTEVCVYGVFDNGFEHDS